jgi:hypothetical protein
MHLGIISLIFHPCISIYPKTLFFAAVNAKNGEVLYGFFFFYEEKSRYSSMLFLFAIILVII